jgi:hypothetical protein
MTRTLEFILCILITDLHLAMKILGAIRIQRFDREIRLTAELVMASFRRSQTKIRT